MARPKSALRQKLEAIALARQQQAAAAEHQQQQKQQLLQAATSPAYTETSSIAYSGTTGATPGSELTAATPSSTSTCTAADEEERSRIAAELERLSSLGPIQINKRNWDLSSDEWKEIMSCVSPGYEAHWDNYPRALTFEENVAGSRMMAEKDPGYCMEIESMESDVSTEVGRASVFMQLKVMESGVTFQGLSTLSWERDEAGRWWCTRHDGFRALNAGFD